MAITVRDPAAHPLLRLLALARPARGQLLLADPALLILDEPTAHLDPANRRSLTADLLAATAGRATLLITHDLDGLADVDEVVVLDRGWVAERGTHASLLAAGGCYARMWRAAQGTRRPEAERPRPRNGGIHDRHPSCGLG